MTDRREQAVGPRRSTSRFYRDPELARFVDDCLDSRRLTYRETVTACRGKFGASRTPSQSAVGRYALKRVQNHTIPPNST
jgi:hypothetical protein